MTRPGMVLLKDPMTDALDRVLDLRAKQHATIVANLANADTPGYRARRLDFRDALAEVRAAIHGGGPKGPSLARGFSADARVELEEPPAWSADGNSVNPEQETMLLNENNVMYSAVAEILRRRFASLEYAITGGQGV